MKLISRLNTQLNQSTQHWREAVHLPWAPHDDAFVPSGSLVVAVALASVAAAIVLVAV